MTEYDPREAFLKDLETTKEESTYTTRRNQFIQFDKYLHRNNIDPLKLSADDIYLYIKQQNRAGASATTLDGYLQVVKQFMDYLIKEPEFSPEFGESIFERDYLEENDVVTRESKYVKELSKQGEETPKAVPRKVVMATAKYAKPPKIRNELIIRLLWQTAMRASELARVEISNIDFERRDITIRSSKLKPSDELYYRHVFYTSDLDYLLRTYIDKERPRFQTAEDSDYLFVTRKKPQISNHLIGKIVRESAWKAEESGEYDYTIQKEIYDDANGQTRHVMTPHRIRHSAISYWANERPDLDLNEIRMLAGHENIETTMQYISTDWDQIRESYQK